MCSSKPSTAPSVTENSLSSCRNNVAHTSYQNPLISQESTMQQVETAYITSSETLSATLATTLKQEQAESPSIQLISSAGGSGESSPIGELQQLSISDDKSLQSQFYIQQQQLNSLQCRSQHLGDNMVEGVPKILNDVFADSTSIPKNIDTNGNCDDASIHNIPDIAINNDQQPDMIHYNLF